MSIQRRQFVKSLSAFAGSTFLTPLLNPLISAPIGKELVSITHSSPEDAATDEDFWYHVRQAYTSSNNLINLNSGGVSPHPKMVQEKVELYTRFANEAPGYYMWRTMGRVRENTRRRLAKLAGCSMTEIAIMRNATEALETAIMGIDLKKGDEVLTTDQDYPSMLNTLEMRSRREGIKINKIALPVPSEDPSEIVGLFENAITSKTKVILVCHMINLTGQILPVRQIARIAHKKGIKVIIDGAHTFCHLDFQIPDLEGDYFGTSLHKWMTAPFGTGMFYVKEENIEGLWPLHGYPEGEDDKISKFEHLGTRSFPIELAIADAIDFHNSIGTPRKAARLRYLKEYWTDQVKDIPGVYFNTSLKKEHSGGIANFGLEGWEPGELGNTLTGQYQLYNTAINHKDIKGVRISPNVFTSLEELDYLAETIAKLAKEKR